MANLLALRRRIQTAANVSKTTRALQMISASKLKRAQEAAQLGRPYVEKLTEVSMNLASSIEKINLHEYMKENSSTGTLTVVISPDKGLAGSLISNLLKELITQEEKNTVHVAIGKKAENFLVKTGRNVVASFPFGTTLPSFDLVYPVIKIIDEQFLGGKVSKVKILSPKFQSIFTQKPQISDLLPIKIEQTGKKAEDMLFEPSVESLLPQLLSHFLEMSVYQNILETYASEQAARMIAMKNATDNAKEVMGELRLEYNKGRQEKITNEILDISGATIVLST